MECLAPPVNRSIVRTIDLLTFFRSTVRTLQRDSLWSLSLRGELRKSPPAHEVGIWLQFDVGRQHSGGYLHGFKPLAACLGTPKSTKCHRFGLRRRLTRRNGRVLSKGMASQLYMVEGSPLMLPVVTMLAPRGARCVCGGAAACAQTCAGDAVPYAHRESH